MDRLARPLSELEEHYDAIVVGTGYGGSIVACRLSRAGRRVALLERGRELQPGEYPTSITEALRQVQTTGPSFGPGLQHGDPLNLYRFHTDGPMKVFSGCGLGGTSLVNANVALEPDAAVLEDPRWPSALRGDPDGTLATGFAAARAMLAPSTYPDSFPRLPKVDALRTAAGHHPVVLTPVNITFRTGTNRAGVHQEASVGCGDCVTGCNHAAKNTVLMNYLPDAGNHGTQIFTEVDVRSVEARGAGGGWIVHAQPLGVGRDTGFHAPPVALTADLVVLAAGTLGSTEILLRSRLAGLPCSERLGHRFTGNGDVLGFAERPGPEVRGIGLGDAEPDATSPPGPCITAMVDFRSGAGHAGFIMEDAVIPGLMAAVVSAELTTGFGGGRRPAAGGWWRRLATGADLFRGRRSVAVDHLQTLLVIGSDDDQGRLVLDDDHVRIEWPGVGGSDAYLRADRLLEEAAERHGGTYRRNPLSSRLLHDSLITVHPLGGCVMADRAEDGVVDHRGRVFRSGQGGRVYDDLIVADGSVVPVPLGVNPLLTISAIAERTVALLITERAWTGPSDATVSRPPAAAPTVPPTGARPGLCFTERMSGWWSPDTEPDDGQLAPFLDAEQRGRGTPGQQIGFVLTLTAEDIDAVIARPDTPLSAVGTVSVPAISTEPLTVVGGTFRLLVRDDPDPAVRHMRYRLPLVSVAGERFHLDGVKVLAPGAVGEAWEASSTLYATFRRDGRGGPVGGRAILRITPGDLTRQLRTIQVLGPVGRLRRLRLTSDFATAFAGDLAAEYGSVVHRTTAFDPSAPPRRKRPIDVPPPRRYEYRTADGSSLRLTRYRGGDSEPVLLSHGMGNPLTWSLDTTEVSLLEYLTANGYDVWVQEWRSSTLLPSSRTQFDGDRVARFDHPEAARRVAAEAGTADLHVVAHCVGALTWTMATLAGRVAPTSLLCSAVAAHPVAPTLTRLKVGMHLGEVLHRLGVGVLTTSSLTRESPGQRLFDLALRLYPIPHAEECDQAVCRRVAFIYGNAVHHPNLDPGTHAALHELFGPTNMTMMDHLSMMARAEEVRDARGARSYLTEEHLHRLDRPMGFLSGARNLVWLPESTRRTYDLLTTAFTAGNYTRTVVDGYGHQDVWNGATAVRDTFPVVLEHLRRVNA